jgi:hypothetical protein
MCEQMPASTGMGVNDVWEQVHQLILSISLSLLNEQSSRWSLVQASLRDLTHHRKQGQKAGSTWEKDNHDQASYSSPARLHLPKIPPFRAHFFLSLLTFCAFTGQLPRFFCSISS